MPTNLIQLSHSLVPPYEMTHQNQNHLFKMENCLVSHWDSLHRLQRKGCDSPKSYGVTQADHCRFPGGKEKVHLHPLCQEQQGWAGDMRIHENQG